MHKRKLGRRHNSRQALLRSLIKGLILHGKIKTTIAKSKAIQSEIDKIMTLAKKDSLAARRQIVAKLGGDRKILSLLFEKYSLLLKKKNSGFTKLVVLGERKGDRAKIVRLELIDIPVTKPNKIKSKK